MAPPTTSTAGSDQSLPLLVDLFRDFLHGLTALESQVAGRAALDQTDPGVPRGQAPAVHDSAAALLAQERARALEQGVAAKDPYLALTLGLAALTADATFASLPGWGHGAAPLLADTYPLPGPESLAQRVADLLDSTDPQPELAELYLLALTAGAGATVADPAERRALADSRPALARIALGGARVGDPLFPQAYPQPRRHGPPRTMPLIRRWAVAVPAAFVALVGLTLFTWWSILHDVADTVCRFMSALGS